MNYKNLLDEVRSHVISFFSKHHNPKLVYHNLNHTKAVVAATTQIANHYQLNDEDFFVTLCAAWFHDTGYLLNVAKHELSSTQIAGDYLKHKGVDSAVIDKVNAVIMATQMPQKPADLLSEILCDADLFHLGTEDYRKKSKLLREECSLLAGHDLDKNDWRQKTIDLMTHHVYFTDYCRLLLNDQKEKNRKELQQKQDENLAKHTVGTVVVPDAMPGGEHEPDHEKKKKSERPERGIETMFRISSTNHQRLSDMADNKAHIMITVNSIILSAIISLVLRKLDDSSVFMLPTFLLLAVSLLTITFSILATRPSIPSGEFTPADLEAKRVNLLFFGNFYRMSLEAYAGGMQQVMEDKDFLYGTLIRDNYSQGVVLGKKYRLLRVSYNIFMFGLIAAVAAFILASVLNK
jgi:predicted metal-dependent HD superfamily phosphohydrolase